MMEPIYRVISWVLLRWHWVWEHVIPGDGRFLGTSWEWVLAIVSLVVTVRLVLFPIFVKQIKSQRAMQALAPKVRELQAKHKGDPQTLREEMMKLYQTEKVNPLMGCLPMFLQIPVFFGLFHVLKYINPLGTAPKTLYGWTEAQFDSAAAAQLFTAPIPGAFNMDAARIAALGGAHAGAAKIVAAVLVLVMMFTTFTTQRQMILKTGWQQESQQRLIQKLMLYGIPVSLLLSGWAFPIGVIIYWVTQNIVTLLQQQWVLRKYPPMVTAPEPPKSARERAAMAARKEPSALARFFLVLPPAAKPAGAVEKRGWLSRIGERVGFAKPSESTAPEPVQRSLAPRPGAKPRVAPRPDPDESARRAESATAEAPHVTPAKPMPAKPTPGSKPKVARPAASPVSGAKPGQAATPNGAGANGSTPTGTAPHNGGAAAGTAAAGNGGTAANKAAAANGGAAANGAAAANGSTKPAGAGAAKPRPAARKATPAKSGARKSGQSGRKGSGRR